MVIRFSKILIQRAEVFRSRYLSTVSNMVAFDKMPDRLQAHQQSLPRLPVPPLHASLEKYLLSVRPLLSEEEYKYTENIVKEFGKPDGLGVQLHSLLKERAKVTENWLDEWWLNSAYLEFRMPVVLYSSPGLVFPLKQFASQEKQLRYASRLVAGALDYKKLIDTHSLPLDKAGNDPLDMSQYYKIFGTCRIPKLQRDQLRFHGLEEKPTHIVVVHNNHYFCVDVYGHDGRPLNESQVYAQLQSVLEQSQFPKDPIGVLTTSHRDNWAKAYKHLVKYDAMNKQSVQTIQKSIFLLCLDKAVPCNSLLNRKTHVALQTIHGGGAKQNAGNRWYDKTLQFIVGEDGVAGLTYEHSPAEGPPITSMMDHIIDYMEKTKGNKWLPSTSFSKPQKLKFRLSEETMQHIAEAEQDLDNLVSDLEMSCFAFEPYGKDFIKSQKMSPDSFIQIAIQLAYYKISPAGQSNSTNLLCKLLYNQIAATYESGTSRKFLHGRTETIRSASIEALDFCKIMLDKSSPVSAKSAAMRNAIDAHKKYVMQAVNGMGIDRMLLGLKKIALEHGMNVPELFLDTGYTTSTHFKLSTSQVPSKVDAFMCYGPLVPDGYGCCYNPLPCAINFGLSACNSSPETQSEKFMGALIESLIEMHDLVNQAQKAKL